MKNIFLILILLVFVSCKNEKKIRIEKKSIEQQTNSSVQQSLKKYPELMGVSDNIDFIFDYGYQFADDLFVDYICIENKGENKYQFILSIADSNLKNIEELKVSAIFYAKEPHKFKDKIYKEKKSRQVASKCIVFSFNGEKVIAYDFEIVPKEFHKIKFYFYSDKGVVNDKIITVRNVSLLR